MANAADQLNARRFAMLVRYQRDRQNRGRSAARRAALTYSAVEATRLSAGARLDARGVLRAARLKEVHELLHGRLVDLDALHLLATLEQDLQNGTVAMQDALAEAQVNLRESEPVLIAAEAMLALEVKSTSKRERLADKMLALQIRASEAADEAEREHEGAINWNAR